MHVSKLPARLFGLFALLLALTLFAAACGDDGGDGDDGDQTPSDGTPGGEEVDTDHGVSDTEITLGMTLAQSGNPSASAYSVIATAITASLKKTNEEDGGVCGRQINLVIEDDQYDPAQSLTKATKLAVQDDVVAFIGNLGTPAVTGQIDYINDPNGDGDTSDGIPHLYLSTGAAKWDDPEKWPWTIGYIPDYVSEGRILAQTVNEMFPGQTVGILFQNDDFGQDGIEGFKEVFEGEIVAEESYEAVATEVTSQLAVIRDADPDIVYTYSLPTITASIYRYMAANSWDPQVVTSYVNANTLLAALVGGNEGQAAGFEQTQGLITTNYLLDPITNATDAAFLEHARIMEAGEAPPPSSLTLYGDSLARLVVHTLEVACDNGDMTRAGVLEAAESIQGYTSDIYLPDVEVNLGPDDHFAIQGLIPVQIQTDGSLLAVGEYTDVSDAGNGDGGDETPE
jgi:ABC-type branched-subunit amino acid transport system substrate-binding protein